MLNTSGHFRAPRNVPVGGGFLPQIHPVFIAAFYRADEQRRTANYDPFG